MANFLNAAQWNALGGPSVGGIGKAFRHEGIIQKGAASYDVTSDVDNWGTLTLAIVGVNPGTVVQAPYPVMSWTLNNATRLYSDGAPGSIWGSDLPQTFEAKLTTFELVSATSEVQVSEYVFDVEKVESIGQKVIITSASKLRRFWSPDWERELHRHAVDWNGNSHAVTL